MKMLKRKRLKTQGGEGATFQVIETHYFSFVFFNPNGAVGLFNLYFIKRLFLHENMRMEVSNVLNVPNSLRTFRKSKEMFFHSDSW